ncbi:hypothetical protein CEXT_643681 [Caerostris extrusa]|uniref:Uncharacterized protein n=1 Tax=Caerostris extrusa TaxID=172846 RepID=A0AAV4XVG2_CAEEX|nr:hypothetical protein CEXT_643681 [Caerostris extrusa]
MEGKLPSKMVSNAFSLRRYKELIIRLWNIAKCEAKESIRFCFLFLDGYTSGSKETCDEIIWKKFVKERKRKKKKTEEKKKTKENENEMEEKLPSKMVSNDFSLRRYKELIIQALEPS